jgi:hypothetical protein
LGAEVSWHDPVVRKWNGQNSCELKSFDVAIVVTKHDVISEAEIKACARRHAQATRSAGAEAESAPVKLWFSVMRSRLPSQSVTAT